MCNCSMPFSANSAIYDFGVAGQTKSYIAEYAEKIRKGHVGVLSEIEGQPIGPSHILLGHPARIIGPP